MTREAHAPTREAMAQRLELVKVDLLQHQWQVTSDSEAILAAASALRQTCAGCRHFERHSTRRGQPIDQPLKWVLCTDRNVAVYQFDNDDILPRDGTGYCHRFSPKEP